MALSYQRCCLKVFARIVAIFFVLFVCLVSSLPNMDAPRVSKLQVSVQHVARPRSTNAAFACFRSPILTPILFCFVQIVYVQALGNLVFASLHHPHLESVLLRVRYLVFWVQNKNTPDRAQEHWRRRLNNDFCPPLRGNTSNPRLSVLRPGTDHASLQQRDDYTDMKFVCGGEVFHVHKSVVCSQSDFLKGKVKWTQENVRLRLRVYPKIDAEDKADNK